MPKIETEDERMYVIGDNCLGWRAGSTPDGRQVLALRRSDRAHTAIYFDAAGDLLTVREIEEMSLSDWERESGFRPGTVYIHRFAHGDVLVRDLPNLYTRFENGDLDVNKIPGQQERLKTALEDWRGKGRFVFVWGQENWMNSDGSVYAT